MIITSLEKAIKSICRSCTCDGEEHPGPSNGQGRGAPEIDALEAQKNKLGDGGKVSQSAQFAPFSHDYFYKNDTTDAIDIFDTGITQPNTYHGSAVQQAVSGLTDLPADIFNGTGGNFYTFGFEYWTDPANPDQGYIIWVANGKESLRMGASAVDEDPLPDGSGVGRRLIPEEPMVRLFFPLLLHFSLRKANFLCAVYCVELGNFNVFPDCKS